MNPSSHRKVDDDKISILDDDTQKALLCLLRLQRNIKLVDAAQWDSSVQNFLMKLSQFVDECKPTSFSIKVDNNGNPDVSFAWSTPDKK